MIIFVSLFSEIGSKNSFILPKKKRKDENYEKFAIAMQIEYIFFFNI